MPIPTLVKVDLNKQADQHDGLHNRWHPDIPIHATVDQNKSFKIECLDWTGGQIKNNDSADDILNVDLTKIHYLSGPIAIQDAEPGDVLCVEIQDIQPLEDQLWGYCGVFDKTNGGGFLDDYYPKAAKAIWDFEGIYTTSRHVPGVKFAGLIHPGILGTAPSHDILSSWNEREQQLVLENSHDLDHVYANLPNDKNAYAGLKASSEILKKVGLNGARTIPGRPEHGGNCDIKNLSRGSKVYVPVHVKGGKLSVGDLHFSQGDGEISFCGAIEMPGVITLKCNVLKNGLSSLPLRSPLFIPGPVEPQFGSHRYLTFEGFSVDLDTNEQRYLDTTLAYKQTCLRIIEYLKSFGYNGYQIYLLLSCAPVQGHVAGVVDVPNSCTTIGLPIDIFEFDISPDQQSFHKRDLGNCAFASK